MTRRHLDPRGPLGLLLAAALLAPAAAQEAGQPQDERADPAPGPEDRDRPEAPPLEPQPPSEAREAARRLGEAFSAVARAARPAVVHVEVVRQVEGLSPYDLFDDEMFRRFFPRPDDEGPRRERPRFRQRAEGSGFLITPDGLLLTNHHVVADAEEIDVQLVDGRSYEAAVVGSDEQTDVAILRLEEAPTDLPYLRLGDSEQLEVGEWVIAVGNPFGLSATVTAGIVSATGRSDVGIADYEDFIQTDAAINPGNSGGPLLDLDGRVVGMATAIFTRTGGYQGVGFAIPISLVRRIQDELMRTGTVTRAYLGVVIQELTPELAGAMGVEATHGVVVSEVSAGSPAAEAGIEVGDIIVQLDGRDVQGVGWLRNAVSLTRPGTTVELGVLRAGEPRQVAVVLAELPEEETGAPEEPGEEEEPIPSAFGLSVSALTPAEATRLGYEDAEGVLVREVERGSPAEEAGIEPGALIARVGDQQVRTPEEFAAAMTQAEQRGEALLLTRSPEGGSRFVLLEVREPKDEPHDRRPPEHPARDPERPGRRPY